MRPSSSASVVLAVLAAPVWGASRVSPSILGVFVVLAVLAARFSGFFGFFSRSYLTGDVPHAQSSSGIMLPFFLSKHLQKPVLHDAPPVFFRRTR